MERSHCLELIRWTRPSRSPRTTLEFDQVRSNILVSISSPAATTDHTGDGVVRAELAGDAAAFNILGEELVRWMGFNTLFEKVEPLSGQRS